MYSPIINNKNLNFLNFNTFPKVNFFSDEVNRFLKEQGFFCNSFE
jgi:hypothetical protein